MNRLITTNNGGHPLMLNDFRWIESGIMNSFKALISAFNPTLDGVIVLSGCERTLNGVNASISEGYIAINGEICFVPSHTFTASQGSEVEYWMINETFENSGLKAYQSGQTYDTYAVRTGKVMVAANLPNGAIKYSDAPNLYQIINANTDTVPTGVIMMWSGSIQSIPNGYSLCDGNNGTPDLRGRFIVGVDPRTSQPPANDIWDQNYNVVGNVGGEKNHTLSISEMPAHTHTIGFNDSTDEPSDPQIILFPNASIGNNDTYSVEQQSAVKGNNSAHNNLPPYYVMAFIIKTGSFVPSTVNSQVDPGLSQGG